MSELKELALVRVLLIVLAIAAGFLAAGPRAAGLHRTMRGLLFLWALLNIVFMVYLWGNHLPFPLNLDLMEGTVFQHFSRAVAGTPVYPAPEPAYVPLAYNPLFYFLAVPVSWVLGVNLFTLRFTAILGMVGIGWILYSVAKRRTASTWWAILTVGLFAAAYRVMDAYLDSAHSDSWFIFSAMAGTMVVQANRSRPWNVIGVVLLILSFWFKQHGAWFAIGGVLFLTVRGGVRRSWPYWLTSVVLGPVAYLWLGPLLFGTHFHYFTWEVPRQWSELTPLTVMRYGGFLIIFYLPLLAPALWLAVSAIRSGNWKNDAWLFQLSFALVTGAMGSLDAGSSNNVYIAQGVWLILVGTMGLCEFIKKHPARLHVRPEILALSLAFAVSLYDPRKVIVQGTADESYADLQTTLKGLEGQVYAPSVGYLQSGFMFFPTAHWVALEDMVRGPGKTTANHPLIRGLLEPATDPVGKAYILANVPLDFYPWLAFLGSYYVLEADLGDRFEPLRVLPKRWDHGWPRYLYRHTGNGPSPPVTPIKGGLTRSFDLE